MSVVIADYLFCQTLFHMNPPFAIELGQIGLSAKCRKRPCRQSVLLIHSLPPYFWSRQKHPCYLPSGNSGCPVPGTAYRYLSARVLFLRGTARPVLFVIYQDLHCSSAVQAAITVSFLIQNVKAICGGVIYKYPFFHVGLPPDKEFKNIFP